MDLDTIVRQVSDKTALSDAAGSAERTFLIRACNEGIRQVLMDTRCTVTKVEFDLVANQSEYQVETALDDVTGEILAVVDYTNDDDNRRTLTVTSATDVFARRLWGNTGEARRFALLGSNLIVVNPTPTEVGTASFYAVVKPADLNSGTQDLFTIGTIPTWAQKAVEWWMCIEASQKNKDYQGVQFYTDLYNRECIKVRKRNRWIAGRRIPPAKIGYPEMPNVRPARNDYDDGA